MEEVDIPGDLAAWCKSQATDEPVTEPVEFVPFESKLPQFNALIQDAAPVGRPSDGFMSTMKGLVRQVIPLADEEGDLELQYAWKASMDDIMDLAWDGNLPEAEHYSKFNIMIREPAGRRLWKNFMNRKRITACFELQPSAFDIVGNLLIGVLNECERKDDVYIARQAIILSQTFFCTSIAIENSDKVFLSTKIVNHTIWEKKDIWHKIIDLSIRDELQNYG